jgi:predicted RNase H-like HicB family nuclease
MLTPNEAETARKVILYTDEDGYWVAECPSLPGCHSQGTTEEEAIANIREAMGLWIEDARKRGEPVPEDNAQVRLLTLVPVLA